MDTCPNCEGTELTWTAQPHSDSPVVDGRLRLNEVKVILVQGCDECSETVKIIDAESELGYELLNGR